MPRPCSRTFSAPGRRGEGSSRRGATLTGNLDQEREAAMIEAGAHPDVEADASLAQARVLCVNDDPMVLSAIRRVLRREPYSILTTDDPRVALQWVEEGKADVLLTDLWMPGMSGTELLKLAKEKLPDLQVAILTAQPDTSALLKRCDGDVRKLITKPWNE